MSSSQDVKFGCHSSGHKTLEHVRKDVKIRVQCSVNHWVYRRLPPMSIDVYTHERRPSCNMGELNDVEGLHGGRYGRFMATL